MRPQHLVFYFPAQYVKEHHNQYKQKNPNLLGSGLGC